MAAVRVTPRPQAVALGLCSSLTLRPPCTLKADGPGFLGGLWGPLQSLSLAPL